MNPGACCGHTTDPMRCDEDADGSDEACEEPAQLRCEGACNRCLCAKHEKRPCLDGNSHRAEFPACTEPGCEDQARRVCSACGVAVCMRHAVKDL